MQFVIDSMILDVSFYLFLMVTCKDGQLNDELKSFVIHISTDDFPSFTAFSQWNHLMNEDEIK